MLQGDLDVLVNRAEFHCYIYRYILLRGLNKKNSTLKKFVFKKISAIDIPKSSKLHRYVNKVRKLYHARYKCNNKCDPKIINLNKMAILIRIKAGAWRFNQLDYCVLPWKAVYWSFTVPREFPRPFIRPSKQIRRLLASLLYNGQASFIPPQHGQRRWSSFMALVPV